MVVYRCVTGRYDRMLLPQVTCDQNFRFVLFTDKSVSAHNGWEIYPLASPPRLKNGHDINRWHKIFSHHLFPESELSIYLDGNVWYSGDLGKLISGFSESGALIGLFRHPAGRLLQEEVGACIAHNKFDLFDRLRSGIQIDYYTSQGFDPSAAIGANYFIIRRHLDSNLQHAMSLWWSHLFEYAKRDQLSLAYALWKHNIAWLFLDEIPSVNSVELSRWPHNGLSTFLRRSFRMIKGGGA